jgi:endonuclease V-like protein UPF0215 family
MLKREIRLLGIDDAPFDKSAKRRDTLVIGVLFRGGAFMDGCLSTKVRIDGRDSTSKLIWMVNSCKWKSQLKAILLDGIAVGGFNIIDIAELNAKTGIPVIVVIRRMPDLKRIKDALELIGMADKIKLLEKAGKVHNFKEIFYQCAGIGSEDAKAILKLSSTRSLIPEPIRVAHLIGQGIVLKESKGRA